MTQFLTHVHAELRRALLTRRGATHRPEDVPKGMHKKYPRMPQVPLPKPEAITASLSDVLSERHSAVSGNPSIPLTLRECGTLLGQALRVRGTGTSRNYPSGGALYPIETYVISTALESQAPGVFHYDPTGHSLEKLLELPRDFDMRSLGIFPESLPLSTLVVFTSVWKRSSAKYGDFTYGVALLEAGHMSENVLLVGTALGLELRPFAGFRDDRIAELLDLDESEEQTVHTVTVCKK